MDIIVELADGSITDIEMQKIGYLKISKRLSRIQRILQRHCRIPNKTKGVDIYVFRSIGNP